MQTTLSSATECFQRLVDAKVCEDVDDCWKRFATYLADRTASDPAAVIGFFHGAIGKDLMNCINRWLEKGPSNLLNPMNNEGDAQCFREFDHKPEVLSEVKGFIESEKYGHLLD
jgi:hypothetical protein